MRRHEPQRQITTTGTLTLARLVGAGNGPARLTADSAAESSTALPLALDNEALAIRPEGAINRATTTRPPPAEQARRVEADTARATIAR